MNSSQAHAAAGLQIVSLSTSGFVSASMFRLYQLRQLRVSPPAGNIGRHLYSTFGGAPEWLTEVLKSEGGGYIIGRAGLLMFPVVWGNMDAMKHVNNVQYLKWFESARVNYLYMLDKEYTGSADFLSGKGVGPIMRSANVAWRHPITYPDRISVFHKIDKIETDRVQLKGVVVSHNARKVAARIDEIQVTVNYDAGTVKTPIPPKWRDMFEKELALQANH